MSSSRLSIEELLKITNFNRIELEILAKKFNELAVVNDKIDRSRFRDMLADQFSVDDSLIMDRVFRCFDIDADNYIGHDEFMKGMSVFLKGRYEDKLKFCFRVYDLNGDRYISKEEMYQMLKFCLVRGAEEDEDGIKDLVDLVLKKLDEDRDGRVSESDWAGAIAKESLLMEAFGQCLPSTDDIHTFLNPNADDLHGSKSASSYSLNSFGHSSNHPFHVPRTKHKQNATCLKSASAKQPVVAL